MISFLAGVAVGAVAMLLWLILVVGSDQGGRPSCTLGSGGHGA